MSARTLLILGASVVAFLLAAKAHGRQLRLERELAGYPHVVFGGTNPPFVEALWRADRVRYWSIAGGVALTVLGLFALARAQGWGWPFLGGGSGSVAWLAVWGSLVGAFLASGLWSLTRFLHTVSQKPEGTVDTAWVSTALRGSAGWFTAAALATGLILLASLRKG
jgi:hypothetical protein